MGADDETIDLGPGGQISRPLTDSESVRKLLAAAKLAGFDPTQDNPTFPGGFGSPPIALTGTPSVGQVPTATDASNATWQTLLGLVYDGSGNLIGVTLTCQSDTSVTRTISINASGDLVLT